MQNLRTLETCPPDAQASRGTTQTELGTFHKLPGTQRLPGNNTVRTHTPVSGDAQASPGTEQTTRLTSSTLSTGAPAPVRTQHTTTQTTCTTCAPLNQDILSWACMTFSNYVLKTLYSVLLWLMRITRCSPDTRQATLSITHLIVWETVTRHGLFPTSASTPVTRSLR